ncbi:MAG: [FeFe] hydrogenase H-cluster maturation GTPase HydF [Clostridia bacterium]|nr:[FeFe] hydrogenase H-cluster maturation GTPase HydF [Clostridia bacterium]
MSLNSVVSAERLHIGFFGLRNAGKSSLVNAVTGQKLSLVSDVKGTTTDPVSKAMELLPLGPVVIIDTPGIDDEGELGAMRVERARQTLSKIHIAVLVTDAKNELTDAEKELISSFKQKNIPFIIAKNKVDLLADTPEEKENELYVSATNGTNINELKEKIAFLSKDVANNKKILADLIKKGDKAVLVVPIDESAPKGRLILPQQQTIRELLEIGAITVVVKPEELADTLDSLKTPPRLVITDSQSFGAVSKIVPEDIMLTSFSILFARYKGDLEKVVKGAFALDSLKDGDTLLISEGCTHHRQCKDIGSVKIPDWVRKHSGKSLNFEFTSGGEFPEDLSKYALVIHCGGCMLNEREMQSRLERAEKSGVPITNYGTAIAHIHGILKRSLEPFEARD